MSDLRGVGLLFAIALVVGVESSVQILSERFDSYSVNGRMYQNKTIAVQCGAASFGQNHTLRVNGSDGVAKDVQVRCGVPRYRFLATLAGWVPRDGTLQTGEVCSTRFAFAAPSPEARSAMEQELQSKNAHEQRAQLQRAADNDEFLSAVADLDPSAYESFMRNPGNQRAVAIRLARAANTHPNPRFKVQRASFYTRLGRKISRNKLGVLGAAFTAGFMAWDIACKFSPGMGGCGGPGTGPDLGEDLKRMQTQISDLDAAMRERTDALNRTMGLLADRMTVENEMLALGTRFDSLIAGNISALGQRIDQAQTAAIQAAKNYIDQLGTNLTSAFDTVRTQLATVSTQNQVTAQLLNQTIVGVDERLVNATRDINRNLFALEGSIGILRGDTALHVRSLYGRLRGVGSLLRRFIANVDRRAARTDTYLNLLDQYNSILDTVQSQGVLEPFLSDLGSPPNASSPLYASTFVDELRLIYSTNTGGSTHIAYEARYQLRCSTAFLVLHEHAFNGHRDLLQMIGPVGCAANNSAECACWFVYRERSCTLRSVGAPQTSEAFINSAIINDTFCVTGSMLTNAENVVLETPAAVVNRIVSGHCSRVQSPGSVFRVWSMNTARAVRVVHNTTSICNQSVDAFMDLQREPNYVYFLFTLAIDAMSLPSMYMNSLIDARFGRLAGGLTYANPPFSMVNKSLAECSQFSMMTFSRPGTWLPVYRANALSTEVQVEVFVNGKLVDRTTQATLDTGFSSLLSEATHFVGYVDGGPDSEVFDVPKSEVVLSPMAETRRGSVTYALCGDDPRNVGLEAAGCDHASWKRIHNVDFDHHAAVNVPSIYRTDIDSDGYCAVTSRKLGSGDICSIRDQFRVAFYPGSFGLSEGVVEFTPRGGSYIANVRIPDGQILTELITACPIAGARMLSSTRMGVELQNVRNALVQAIVRPDPGFNDICSVPIVVQLQPRQTFTVELTPCTINSSRPNSVVVTTGFNQQDIEICTPTPLNVTVDRERFVTVLGNPDTTVINKTTRLVLDGSSLALARISLDLSLFMYDMIVAMANVSFRQGLPVDPITYAPFDDLRLKLEEHIRNNQRTITNITNTTFPDFEGGANDTAREMDRYINETMAAIRERDEVIRVLQENVARQGQVMALLLNITEEFKNASRLYVELQRRVDVMDIAQRNQTLLILRALADAVRNRGLGLDWLDDLGDGIADVARGFYNGVADIAEAAAEGAGDIFGIGGSIGRLMRNILAGITIFLFVVIGAYLLYSLYNCLKNRRPAGGGSGGERRPLRTRSGTDGEDGDDD